MFILIFACTSFFSTNFSLLYYSPIYFSTFRELNRIPYAFSLVLSISRREEPFPLAQHFHPDHHDPDDRVCLTERSAFPFFLSASSSFFIHLAKNFFEHQTSPSHVRTMPWKSHSGTIRAFATRFQLSRESEERSV